MRKWLGPSVEPAPAPAAQALFVPRVHRRRIRVHRLLLFGVAKSDIPSGSRSALRRPEFLPTWEEYCRYDALAVLIAEHWVRDGFLHLLNNFHVAATQGHTTFLH